MPRTLPWLWRFHRQAREETARQVSEPLFALYHSSVELHEGLAREAGAQALIRSTRYLYLYRKPEDYNPNALEWQLRRQYGAEIEVHDGVEAIRELEPSLAPVYRRAVTVGPLARTLEPYRLTVAYADLLRRMGGTVLQAEVTRLESSPAGVSRTARSERAMSGAPSRSSSSRIWVESAGCETCARPAARPKCRSSARAMR